MAKKKSADKSLPINVKKDKTDEKDPGLGTAKALKGFKVYNDKVPELKVGDEHDEEGKWYSLYLISDDRTGYLAYGSKSDRDDMARAIVACITDAATKMAKQLAEDAKVAPIKKKKKKKSPLPKKAAA